MQNDNLSELVWNLKYRKVSRRTGMLDRTFDDSVQRICRTVYNGGDREEIRKFKEAVNARQLLPGGRIIAGADTLEDRTLNNTFVIGELTGEKSDTLEKLRISAQTMRCGGGIGCNLSAIPPLGATLVNGGSSPGIVATMRLWDAMCGAIVSSDAQRGAMMMVLDCRHPEIFKFVEAKTGKGALQYLNASVLISDDFMRAQAEDEGWCLSFEGGYAQNIRARTLWDLILRSSYDAAEPGVIFIDRIQSMNNLHHTEQIIATNSCAEQPLPKNGSVPLASVNLAELVVAPFTDQAELDLAKLHEIVAIGTRFLDRVVDCAGYPTQLQELEAQSTRRIGLGFTGLADALAMCKKKYGSSESIVVLREWMVVFRDASYEASSELAAQQGAYPRFEHADFMKTPMASALPMHVLNLIEKNGLRNAVINSIAPTGSISILANNVSSGIEPIFAHKYRRKIVVEPGRSEEHIVESFSARTYRMIIGPHAALPDYMVTVSELTPSEHLIIQGTVQQFIDASISKTVNCREDIDLCTFFSIYDTAFSLGCKSISTYRPNLLRGQILTAELNATPNSGPAN